MATDNGSVKRGLDNAFSINHTPAADVAEGEVVVQGTMVGLATRAIASGEVGALVVGNCVIELPKDVASGGTLTAGQQLYWDTSNSEVTNIASSHNKIGKAEAAVAQATTTVLVVFDGISS